MPVRVNFRNVLLRVDDAAVVEIRRLTGALTRTRPDRPPAFDDQRSFTLHVETGEIAISPESLSHLLNAYVFAGEHAPLEDLEVSIDAGRLKQKGKLRKGLDIPFSIVAEVSTTEDGRIRLHPASVKALGLPTGRLLKLIDVELDELIKLNRTPGVELQDNDFLLTPGALLPAPHLDGRVTSVRLESNRLVQVFGPPNAAGEAPPPDARNFMAYRGGTLRFGKLTMSDTDMVLIDADPSDPFDIFPDRYLSQLTKGYSKTTPTGGLKVYMPDFTRGPTTDLRPPHRLP